MRNFIKVKVPVIKEKIRVDIDKTETKDMCIHPDVGKKQGSISIKMEKFSENRKIKDFNMIMTENSVYVIYVKRIKIL